MSFKNNYATKAGLVLHSVRTFSMIAASIMLIISCGNKGDSSGSSGSPGPLTNTNFGAGYVIPGQEVLLSSVHSVGPWFLPVVMNWQFMANQAQIYQGSGFGYSTSIQKSYNGPIAARGTMTIPTTYRLGSCVIPAGSYTLVPLAAGQWGPFGFVNIPSFAAVSGGTQLLMSLIQGVIVDPNADGNADKVAGSLVFQRISSGAGTTNCIASSIYLN